MRKTKAKKIIISIMLSIILLPIIGVGLYASTVEKDSIVFKDRNFYNYVLRNVFPNAISDESTLTLSDIPVSKIQGVKTLELTNEEIKDISGIEKFVGVENLNLSGNVVSDFTPVKGLTNIKTLNVSNMIDQDLNIKSITNENMEIICKLTTLEELDMGGNGILDVNYNIINLTNLRKLDLRGNDIKSLPSIKGLTKLININLSENINFNDLQAILDLKDSLQVLKLKKVGITELEGIDTLTNLVELDLSGNTQIKSSEWSKLFKTKRVQVENETVEVGNLENLKVVNFSEVKSSDLGISSGLEKFKIFPIESITITNSNIRKLGKIYLLRNLKYLNLNYNELENLDGFVGEIQNPESNEKEKICVTANNIELAHNKIVDVRNLSDFIGRIESFDLSYNAIMDTCHFQNILNANNNIKLNLKYQNAVMKVYVKRNNNDHYIILPTLFQDSKSGKNLISNPNTEFKLNELELNVGKISEETGETYDKPGYYNVIYKLKDLKGNSLSQDRDAYIEIVGNNVLEGSKLHITTKSNGTIPKEVESIFFNDTNFQDAVLDEIKRIIVEKYMNSSNKPYLNVIPRIINVSDRITVSAMDKLNSYSRNVTDIKGVEDLENLKNFDISKNNVSKLDLIKYCRLNVLQAGYNPIGNENVGIISELKDLENLGLQETKIDNVEFLNKLKEKSDSKLKRLNLAGNYIKNIQQIEGFYNLEELYVQNNQIVNLPKISEFAKLTILNISSNKISDLTEIGKNNSIITFISNSNDIKTIQPLANNSRIETVQLNNNRITDIKPLKNLKLQTLLLNNNYIEDITAIQNIEIATDFQINGQKLIHKIESTDSNSVISIPLPQIIVSSQKSTSKVYSKTPLYIVDEKKCATLSENGENLNVDLKKLNESGQPIIQVEIPAGNAKHTILTIAVPVSGTIEYNPKDITNQDVKATLKGNRDIKVLNNGGENSHIFKENGEFTFEFEDCYGFTGKEVSKVTWIDKNAPVITGVENGIKYRNSVKVSIKDENLASIQILKDGAQLDNNILNKEIAEEGNYEIIASDIVGNETRVKFSIEKINDVIISEKYNVDEENRKIYYIEENTTVEKLDMNINQNLKYEIYDNNGRKLSKTDKLGTGYTIKMATGKEYKISVLGDVNGDTKLSISDVSISISQYLGKDITKFIKGIDNDLVLKSLDFNRDGKNSLIDVSRLKTAFLNK